MQSKKSFSGKGIFPYQYAFTLLIPFRNIFLSPKKLIEYLELKNDSTVLEVGSGPGYFSKKVSKFLSNGSLVLADIQEEMLKKAKKRLEKNNIKNVQYYLCDGEEFNFPNNYFDVIFMVTVIGEIENKEKYLKEFYRILNGGGILSISEQAGDPDKMKIEEVRKLAEDNGFIFYKLYGKEKNYTINLKKY